MGVCVRVYMCVHVCVRVCVCVFFIWEREGERRREGRGQWVYICVCAFVSNKHVIYGCLCCTCGRVCTFVCVCVFVCIFCKYQGSKKKAVDPFIKKDWYDLKSPSMFAVRTFGKTLVTRTQGTKIASEGLKGRIFDVSLADLNNDEDQVYRKMKLRCEDVQGRNCLTNFYGMDFTTDKLRSLVRKWQSLIEASVDVKTTDGYVLRMFCIAFTKRMPNQNKRTCYAQSAKIRAIRKKMTEIMVRDSQTCDLKSLVLKFIPESIGKSIEQACAGIFPLQNVFIRKVKILKAPKFDITKLMEVHGDYTAEEVGEKIEANDKEDDKEAGDDEMKDE